MQTENQINSILTKIRLLPETKILEIENFVDFILNKNSNENVKNFQKLAENCFAKVWDNEKDDVYNKL
jgi:hypothetical protein